MRAKLSIIAVMLRLMRTYSLPGLPKRKSWGGILLATLMLLSTFGPALTLMAFRMHVDVHVADCQYLRHHREDCQARCILTEMIPEQTQALAEQATYSLCFSPVPFFQHTALQLPASSEGTLVVSHFFYLVSYASPWPGVQTPPPRFSS